MQNMYLYIIKTIGTIQIIVSLWDNVTGVKNFGFYFDLLPVYIEVLINTEILLVFKQLA